jgi:hypothetical protein
MRSITWPCHTLSSPQKRQRQDGGVATGNIACARFSTVRDKRALAKKIFLYLGPDACTLKGARWKHFVLRGDADHSRSGPRIASSCRPRATSNSQDKGQAQKCKPSGPEDGETQLEPLSEEDTMQTAPGTNVLALHEALRKGRGGGGSG